MVIHRDPKGLWRATPHHAKSRPPRSGRPERGAGGVTLLARATSPRLRNLPCQRLSPSDHDHCGY